MSIVVAILGSLLFQAVCVAVFFWIDIKNRKTEGMISRPRDMMDEVDEVDLGKGFPLLFDDQNPELCAVILPQASMPSVLFLLVARFIIVAWSLCVVALFVDVVVFDRIIRPCPMPWD